MSDLATNVMRRFKASKEDPWIDREMVASLCPECADKMAAQGIRKIRASVIFQAAKWKKGPPGWTNESRKKFWDSLTGDVKHKVTKCMKQMKGKVDDEGAFCASLADRVEGKGWRSE